MLKNFILCAVIPALIVASVLYTCEHNRLLLLLGVYPFAAFYTIGLCAYYESRR